MSEIFFTSDHHFGHANILQYEPIARPFETLTEMHEALIIRWNNVVTKFDKVYHIGDFCFGKEYIEMAALLNGQKRLILGNHDKYEIQLYLKHFLSVHGALFWNDCVLTHIPVHPGQLEHRSKFNLHGHLHSKLIMSPDEALLRDWRYINCSVEQHNLTPVSADQLFK